MTHTKHAVLAVVGVLWLGVAACGRSAAVSARASDTTRVTGAPAARARASKPLVHVADVPLPGPAVRFDYQDIDPTRGHLVVAHMNAGAVDVLDVRDGSLVKRLTGIATPRGVAVGRDRIYVTSSPSSLVVIDAATLTEIARVPTGSRPDGVAWDGTHEIVGVSDQGDGAVSLIRQGGTGARTSVKLGKETGNVVFDGTRGTFWVSVVSASDPRNRLVALDPVSAKVTRTIALPGCEGAHGVRLHPDAKSAFVACEDDDKLARVDLAGADPVVLADTGAGPDVLGVDADLGWLYVAAESGDLVVFDVGRRGLTAIDREHVADRAHSVAVDPASHHVFFPLEAGPGGTPVLRIMRPASAPR